MYFKKSVKANPTVAPFHRKCFDADRRLSFIDNSRGTHLGGICRYMGRDDDDDED